MLIATLLFGGGLVVVMVVGEYSYKQGFSAYKQRYADGFDKIDYNIRNIREIWCKRVFDKKMWV